MSMAIHPPIKTRIAAFVILAPPSFAPIAPKPASAIVEVNTMEMILYLVLTMKEPANSGMAAPKENATADANAACIGLERSSISIPSSSRACALRASPIVSSSATWAVATRHNALLICYQCTRFEIFHLLQNSLTGTQRAICKNSSPESQLYVRIQAMAMPETPFFLPSFPLLTHPHTIHTFFILVVPPNLISSSKKYFLIMA